MAVGDAHVFPGFLTPVLTQLFFPKPPTTFLTYFCRDERRKYAGRKFALTGDRTHSHQVMSQTLTTEPPGRGFSYKMKPLETKLTTCSKFLGGLDLNSRIYTGSGSIGTPRFFLKSGS